MARPIRILSAGSAQKHELRSMINRPVARSAASENYSPPHHRAQPRADRPCREGRSSGGCSVGKGDFGNGELKVCAKPGGPVASQASAIGSRRRLSRGHPAAQGFDATVLAQDGAGQRGVGQHGRRSISGIRRWPVEPKWGEWGFSIRSSRGGPGFFVISPAGILRRTRGLSRGWQSSRAPWIWLRPVRRSGAGFPPRVSSRRTCSI